MERWNNFQLSVKRGRSGKVSWEKDVKNKYDGDIQVEKQGMIGCFWSKTEGRKQMSDIRCT